MKEVLGTLKSGTVVKIGRRWGVVVRQTRNLDSRRWRSVDFWDGGRERVDSTALVQVAPPISRKKEGS